MRVLGQRAQLAHQRLAHLNTKTVQAKAGWSKVLHRDIYHAYALGTSLASRRRQDTPDASSKLDLLPCDEQLLVEG